MLPVVEGRWNGFQPDCSCLRPDYVHIAVEPLAGRQDGRFIGGPPVLVFEADYIAAAAVLLGGFHGLPEQICDLDPATGGIFWAVRLPQAAGAKALVSLLSGQWYSGR